ncbi:NERD domain-containing protein [Marispirochaeta sp.]|uniref:NERD domain-containing protein n=1 Tax=Marispirochaeta sp. TaxID=2038653 RepID=UPI0029C79A8A|nr:NERD domain-containing protein [Marispirochaeta sp.]
MKKCWILTVFTFLITFNGFADDLKYQAISDVNCRAGEFQESLVLFIIHKDDVVDVLESRNNWSFVQTADGKNGFVVSTFLAPINDLKAIQYVIKNDVNCRSKDDIDSEILFVIYKDEVVSVLQKRGGWCYVETQDGNQGFIDGKFLITLPEQSQTIKKTDHEVVNRSPDQKHNSSAFSTLMTILVIAVSLYIFRRRKRPKRLLKSSINPISSTFRNFTNSAAYKGKKGEKRVNLLLNFLKKEHSEYMVLHDVKLPMNADITQIDHIVISRYGIFVIETKNYKGWIFGELHQKKWVKTLYNAKYEFQNPLHQNYKHIKAIESLLSIPLEKVFSIVVFVGDSEFKTVMPINVIELPELLSYIRSFQDSLFTQEEVIKYNEMIINNSA